jgi:hypothetical protein
VEHPRRRREAVFAQAFPELLLVGEIPEPEPFQVAPLVGVVQVVHDEDARLSPFVKRPDEVAADEPRSACDEKVSAMVV